MDHAEVKVVTLPVEEWLEQYCVPEKFAGACETCPDYGKVWSCPPGLPPVKELFASFDRVLEAMSFLKRKDFSDAEKEEYLTFLLFGDGVEPDAELVGAALALLCPKSENSGVRSFDFEQDAAVIYASFLSAYGIDLFSMRGKLHWTAFIALLQNLPADSAFGRLVAIRTCEVPKPTKHNQKQIQDLLRAKAAYRLHISEEERQAQWQAGLQNIAKQMMSSAKAGD